MEVVKVRPTVQGHGQGKSNSRYGSCLNGHPLICDQSMFDVFKLCRSLYFW